jgi:hypothetical protein
MFDILFSLDCGVRRVENFEMNKFTDCILRRVACNASGPVLTDPTDEVVCHADIQCTAGTAGENVDVVLFHDGVMAGLVPAISLSKALPAWPRSPGQAR